MSVRVAKKQTSLALLSLLPLCSCGPKDTSFSLLSEDDTFSQAAASNNKVDILWVVDGSGTMRNHQENLAQNFSTFISAFSAKGFDFHMAVASTDAWVREKNYNAGTCQANPNPTFNPNQNYVSSADCRATDASFAELTHFRDGDIYGPVNGAATHSGQYLISSALNAADLITTFGTNIKVGVRGDGTKEAGFQSLRAVLRRAEDGSLSYSGETHTSLAAFRRPDAFLAVIIVSDEEDQSTKLDGTAYASTEAYVNSFKTFLDAYTESVDGARKYNVSTITIEDINNCSYGLHAQATQGDRYVAIAEATQGIVGSICSSNFSEELDQIAQRIVTLSTRFELSREPVIESIAISVNGVVLESDPNNGWTYLQEGGRHLIQFNGASVPPQGANIKIYYDPVSLK